MIATTITIISITCCCYRFLEQLQSRNGDYVDRLTFSVLPRDCGVGEGSWAGLCFSPSQWSMAAVARSFCKSIDVYDKDIPLRNLRILWYPSSLSFIQNLSHGNESSILALTIWDLRMKENGGCLHRICGSVGDTFYSVCSSSTVYIAVGGADRSVAVYDPRRWSALSRWVHCLKYEITGLEFSSTDSDYIFIQGVDYEVIAFEITVFLFSSYLLVLQYVELRFSDYYIRPGQV
ncbi:hypothetical protein L1049_025989 [Liquidambar formosana]|uniref:Uncharacterized protein n=1 Tax=Liquidambar formosana TaxID=63359 RepID=A0AAP0NEN3_LIQFO